MPDLEVETIKIQITMKKEQNLQEPQTQALNIAVVMPSFDDWSSELRKKMSCYPQIKNKWKSHTFRKMYNDGLNTKDAFRCWYCAH